MPSPSAPRAPATESAGDRGAHFARGGLQLLILQPTPFCNIDCDYCYLPDRDSKARMSPEVLRAAIDRVFESGLAGEGFTVVWHAGEPLVLGTEWYDEAIAAI